MRNPVVLALVVVAAALAAVFAYVMIDIDQTEEARLPKVTVEGGNLPEFEVKTGSVEITKEKAEITVPDVDISTTKKEITVPGIDIKPAQE